MANWRVGIGLTVAAAGAVPLYAQGGSTDSTPSSRLVVNAAQATRGNKVYIDVCVECHETLEYTGPDFRSKWNGRPVYELYDVLRSTMPDGAPGTLTNQQYVDVLAYMMKLNGVPAGKAELPASADALKKIKMEIPATLGATPLTRR